MSKKQMSCAQSREAFLAQVDSRRAARMASVDGLPQQTRELVHEYGLNVVQCLIQLGVTKPNQIRHVVETILDEFSPTRGSFSNQGPRVEVGGFRSADEFGP